MKEIPIYSSKNHSAAMEGVFYTSKKSAFNLLLKVFLLLTFFTSAVTNELRKILDDAGLGTLIGLASDGSEIAIAHHGVTFNDGVALRGVIR